jgi:Mrp family chromosome partitioning ATPase
MINKIFSRFDTATPHAPDPDEPMMPGQADFQLCTRLQANNSQTPEVFSHLYASVERQIARASDSPVNPSQRIRSSFVLGVTSAIGGEGKTTVALHLAMSAAHDTFKTVCLIDLSMGEDDLCRRLGVHPSDSGGVVDILEKMDNIVPALPLVQMVGTDELIIMPAGKVPDNRAKVARSPRVAELIAAAARMFDVVIVDLPSVESDNALPIAAHLDGVLMVVCAGATPRHQINDALDRIGRARVLGVVLNRASLCIPVWLQKRLRKL